MNEKKINVTHIVSGDLWAGAEAQAYELIVGLSQHTWICLNVITFNHGILVEKLINAGVRVDVIPEKYSNMIRMVWNIFKILCETKANIVHTHGYKETFLGGTAARLCKVKAIVRTHHGKGVMEAGLKYVLIENLNRCFFTDKVIAVSEDLKNYLISKKLKEEIITVIHNGINAEVIKPLKSIDVLKDEFQISNEDTVIGTVGRLVPVKGHKYFLEGAKKILEVNEKVVFVVVGDGPLTLELDKQIKKLDISHKVRLLGFKKNIIDIMNIFDIFILTSLHEGVPMVLLEAMCLSKLVVATRVGGIPEIISDNKNGLLIPPKDPEALASACLLLFENNELRTKLADNAYKDIVVKHTTSKLVEKVEGIYNRI